CKRLVTAFCFFFQAEDGIRDFHVTGVQTCALPISGPPQARSGAEAVRLLPELEADRSEAAVQQSGSEAVRSASSSGPVVRSGGRSEERRVGEEGGWQCASGGCVEE